MIDDIFCRDAEKKFFTLCNYTCLPLLVKTFAIDRAHDAVHVIPAIPNEEIKVEHVEFQAHQS